MTQITARLPDDLVAGIDEAARAMNRSRAEVVRQAIEYYLGDLGDLRLALDRLRGSAGPVLDWDQVKRDLLTHDQGQRGRGAVEDPEDRETPPDRRDKSAAERADRRRGPQGRVLGAQEAPRRRVTYRLRGGRVRAGDSRRAGRSQERHLSHGVDRAADEETGRRPGNRRSLQRIGNDAWCRSRDSNPDARTGRGF